MARLTVKQVMTQSGAAWACKQNWDDLLRECYEYALPQRNPYHDNADGIPRPGQTKGQSKTNRVFDSTLIGSATRLANRLQSELTPPFQKWAKLVPGPFVDEKVRDAALNELEPVTETIFAALQISNFDTAINEWFLELVVAGTACMLVMDGDDANPMYFNTVPQSQLAFREGPFGQIWGIYRKHSMTVTNMEGTWTEAKIPDNVKREDTNGKEAQHMLVEACYYCPKDKVWYYDVIVEKAGDSPEARILERKYDSNPWVVARWIKAAGEVQGRSPVMMALPDAKTLNKTKELLLRNASIAVSGVWMVKDNGTINANNIRIFPGATIPVTSTGGQTGADIEPLRVGGDLNLAQFIIEDMINSIKNLMLDKSLPPQSGAVRSATEIIERLKELQQDLGSPFGRVTTEGITPILQKVVARLGDMGILQFEEGKGIKLNDGYTQVQFQSPLARSESTGIVQTAVEWMQIVQGLGQEAYMASVKVEDAGVIIGRQMGVMNELMRSDKERTELQKGMGQLMAQQQGAGIPANSDQSQQIPVAA